jgi:hypothetical protein
MGTASTALNKTNIDDLQKHYGANQAKPKK